VIEPDLIFVKHWGRLTEHRHSWRSCRVGSDLCDGRGPSSLGVAAGVSGIDAVDDSSTRHASAMDVVA